MISAIDTVFAQVCAPHPEPRGKWRRKAVNGVSAWLHIITSFPCLLTANEVMSIKREREPERGQIGRWQGWNELKRTPVNNLQYHFLKQAASASRVQRKIYRIYFNFNSCCGQTANCKSQIANGPFTHELFNRRRFRRHNICHACWRDCSIVIVPRVMYIERHELLLKYRHRRRCRLLCHSQSWKCQFSVCELLNFSIVTAIAAGKVISRNITPLENEGG